MTSTIESNSLFKYKMMLHAALNIEVIPIEVKEFLNQAVPYYCGINKVIDFLNAANEIFREREIQLLVGSQSTITSEICFEKGLTIQKEIIGEKNVDAMYKNFPKDLLQIQHYLLANYFGDYVSRNGLGIKIRELITISFIITLKGTESQIKGYINAHKNVENERQTLIDLMTQFIPYFG